jgi:hypothetical protein
MNRAMLIGATHATTAPIEVEVITVTTQSRFMRLGSSGVMALPMA